MTSHPPCGCLKTRICAASNFIELIPACLIRQTLAIFSEFNSEGLYQSLGKEKGSFRPVSPSSTKTCRHLHVLLADRATTATNCRKKRDTRAKLLFYQSKPIAFLPFSLPSPSSLLKLPNETAAMLVFQTSPVGVELFLMQKHSFVPILKRFAWLLTT